MAAGMGIGGAGMGIGEAGATGSGIGVGIGMEDMETGTLGAAVWGGAGMEADISGLAFSPSGRRLYVGTEQGLAAYDVDTNARMTFAHVDIC